MKRFKFKFAAVLKVRESREENALRAYMITRKETRMIEVLREKEFTEFKKAVKKKEQKELDELSSMRFGQKLVKSKQDSTDGNSKDVA
jgi:flagellar export protein FliJ